MFYNVKVTRPNGAAVNVQVEAPNQRDARNLAIERIYAEDCGVTVSHSLSESARLAEDAGYRFVSLDS